MNCLNCGCELKPGHLFVPYGLSVAPDVDGYMFKQDNVEVLVCPQCGRIEWKVQHPEKFRQGV